MSSPTVDTFEHDIANEIRNKEASITDIASAVGDIGNTEPEPHHAGSAIVSVVVILILCGIVGVGYLLYLYANEGNIPEQQPKTISQPEQSNIQTNQLQSLSPSLTKNIGTFLTDVKKSKTGYTINITSYSPVFAYMIRNENEFGDEFGLALGNSHTLKKVSIPIVNQPVVSSGTPQISTSTQVFSATTLTSTEIREEATTTYLFYDVTISNQNMRLAKSMYGTVVYAFIGTQKLIISSSTDGILSLRNNILHK